MRMCLVYHMYTHAEHATADLHNSFNRPTQDSTCLRTHTHTCTHQVCSRFDEQMASRELQLDQLHWTEKQQHAELEASRFVEATLRRQMEALLALPMRKLHTRMQTHARARMRVHTHVDRERERDLFPHMYPGTASHTYMCSHMHIRE